MVGIREQPSSRLWIVLEILVVVSGAHHAMLERLLSQPTVERDDLSQVGAGVHEVASMDQDITFRHVLDFVVLVVCVRENYESDCLHVFLSTRTKDHPIHRLRTAWASLHPCRCLRDTFA